MRIKASYCGIIPRNRAGTMAVVAYVGEGGRIRIEAENWSRFIPSHLVTHCLEEAP